MTDRSLSPEARAELRSAVEQVKNDRMMKFLRDRFPDTPENTPPGPGQPKPPAKKTPPAPKATEDPPDEDPKPKRRGLWNVGNDDPDPAPE